MDGKSVQLALWDTAGQEDYERLRPLAYSKAHVILIGFSVDTPDSLDNVKHKVGPQSQFYNPAVLYPLPDQTALASPLQATFCVLGITVMCDGCTTHAISCPLLPWQACRIGTIANRVRCSGLWRHKNDAPRYLSSLLG